MRRRGAWILYVIDILIYARYLQLAQRLKENAHGLKLRPEHFESTLQDIGFGGVEHLGQTGEGGRCSRHPGRKRPPRLKSCQDFDDQSMYI